MKLIMENWNKFVNEAFPDVPGAYTPTNKTTKLGPPRDQGGRSEEEIANKLRVDMGIDQATTEEKLVAKHREVEAAMKQPENTTMKIYYALNKIKNELVTKAYDEFGIEDLDDYIKGIE
jgi:hypothetical protein